MINKAACFPRCVCFWQLLAWLLHIPKLLRLKILPSSLLISALVPLLLRLLLLRLPRAVYLLRLPDGKPWVQISSVLASIIEWRSPLTLWWYRTPTKCSPRAPACGCSSTSMARRTLLTNSAERLKSSMPSVVTYPNSWTFKSNRSFYSVTETNSSSLSKGVERGNLSSVKSSWNCSFFRSSTLILFLSTRLVALVVRLGYNQATDSVCKVYSLP
ncbi:hypothetical protein Hamer_G002268 [Homarus americanus]|uniref:Uncharacterized protein n=1 Tax=Homarus americanus TaxID=6706 RepID=A0A8J5MU81_HOMAM|nr:hypothetical protein Hamer_G002268 [Homarus americanus]